MSMLPVEPDTERHCFAPCQPGTFCKCLGEWIPSEEEPSEGSSVAESNKTLAPGAGPRL